MSKNSLRVLAIAFLNSAFLSLGLAGTPIVQLETSSGNITLELYPDDAPITVENFLGYANDGFFDGTVFHRVIQGFMIQGGGVGEDLVFKETKEPIRNEANNGLKNLRGTIAMARTADPHSATAQFFINHADNGFLDFTSETERGWGYAVFGKVIDGLAVVDKIATITTAAKSIQPFPNPLNDVPVENIVIRKATLISESSDAVYDIATGMLDLPIVQIGDQIYSVTMKHSGDGIFDVTDSQLLSAAFDYGEGVFDFATSMLTLKRVRIGDDFYDAELLFIGNGQLQLQNGKPSE